MNIVCKKINFSKQYKFLQNMQFLPLYFAHKVYFLLTLWCFCFIIIKKVTVFFIKSLVTRFLSLLQVKLSYEQ